MTTPDFNTAPMNWCAPCGNYLCAQYGCQRTAPCRPPITEQMGVDPISKLAAAIEKLADALDHLWHKNQAESVE